MYVPRNFAETNREPMFALIEAYSFGLLISNTADGPYATHLPWLLDRERGENGVLLAHMARANPHWQQIDRETPVLVVFQGANGYVSPSWYDDPNLVPTWNYMAVHARGRLRMLEGLEERRSAVQRLTVTAESHFSKPWQLDFTSGGRERMLEQIVAFEVEVSELIGKTKLNQNRSAKDRAGVIANIADGNPTLAEVMRAVDAPG